MLASRFVCLLARHTFGARILIFFSYNIAIGEKGGPNFNKIGSMMTIETILATVSKGLRILKLLQLLKYSFLPYNIAMAQNRTRPNFDKNR